MHSSNQGPRQVRQNRPCRLFASPKTPLPPPTSTRASFESSFRLRRTSTDGARSGAHSPPLLIRAKQPRHSARADSFPSGRTIRGPKPPGFANRRRNASFDLPLAPSRHPLPPPDALSGTRVVAALVSAA
jgi:hypothetical protein